MRLIVGLGNPGKKYENTRHNLGRVVVESLAREWQVSFSQKDKLQSFVATHHIGDEKVILAYPQTYMNLSGHSVGLLANYFSIEAHQDLMVIIDDYAIPFGRIRLRPEGSAGGHNGLKSIDQALHSQAYARLRMGIGEKQLEDEEESSVTQPPLEKYVLAKFSKAEMEGLEPFVARGIEACQRWISEPIEQAMSAVNSLK